MQSFSTIADLRTHLAPLRRGKIALVPTMGALHAGHLSLIQQANSAADHVVVSIFVNPAQFAPHEDFDTYPRDVVRDMGLIADLGLDNVTIFMPDVSEIYPAPAATKILLGEIDTRWESPARPHFFSGVSLVITKLFNIVQPDIALFGEKDFQQLQVIRQLVRDLSMPIEIIGALIVRETSGLAMSSRNAYLTGEEHNVIAPQLYQALQIAAEKIRAGDNVGAVLENAKQYLATAGFAPIDYFAYVDAETLTPLALRSLGKAGSRLLIAARLGKARLIDNIAVT